MGEHAAFVEAVLAKEEQAFRRTLRKGIKQLRGYRKTGVTGAELFVLYDTFGFPVELSTEEAAAGRHRDERGLARGVRRSRWPSSGLARSRRRSRRLSHPSYPASSPVTPSTARRTSRGMPWRIADARVDCHGMPTKRIAGSTAAAPSRSRSGNP